VSDVINKLTLLLLCNMRTGNSMCEEYRYRLRVNGFARLRPRWVCRRREHAENVTLQQ